MVSCSISPVTLNLASLEPCATQALPCIALPGWALLKTATKHIFNAYHRQHQREKILRTRRKNVELGSPKKRLSLILFVETRQTTKLAAYEKKMFEISKNGNSSFLKKCFRRFFWSFRNRFGIKKKLFDIFFWSTGSSWLQIASGKTNKQKDKHRDKQTNKLRNEKADVNQHRCLCFLESAMTNWEAKSAKGWSCWTNSPHLSGTLITGRQESAARLTQFIGKVLVRWHS